MTLKKIWLIMGYICGKRLAPILKEIIFRLKEYNEIVLRENHRGKTFQYQCLHNRQLLK
jgi:hypothetical protein